MTQFIPYENLTWPEVADLPRDTPMVIPLGEGYPLEKLADSLGSPPRAYLLPPLPYGWLGSGLAVPEALLAAYLNNLVDSLREDGFTRAYALIPQGVNLGLGASAIRLLHPARLLPAPLIPPDEDRDKVVLIPIGHTEQHAYHLPMCTDTLIIEAITLGVASAVPEQAAALPAMPYGVSTHRAAFAGTLNAGGRAFEDFWLGVLDALVGRGFSRFYLLSGHGGNCSFLTNAVKYAGERHPQAFIATTWLYLSSPDGIAALQSQRRSGIGGMGHAGELETSLMLHLRPDLVDMGSTVDEITFISTPSFYMDWVEGGALVANPPWEDDTSTGSYGAGSLGSAQNGEIWLQAAIAEKIAHVAEILEQYNRRRLARRTRGQPAP